MAFRSSIKAVLKAKSNFHLFLFALLSLAGIVFTFLPDQKTKPETSVGWVLNPGDSQSSDQQKSLANFWTAIRKSCQASFIHFYIPVFEQPERIATRFAVQSQKRLQLLPLLSNLSIPYFQLPKNDLPDILRG